MAGPVEQTGVVVACPRCGQSVLQKTMIPLGILDSVVNYVCAPCARTMIMTNASSVGGAAPAEAVDA